MKIEPKESRMPSSIATSSPRGAATFFCRLEFIEIKGALGSSAEFTDNFFITDDQSTIDKLLDWRYLEAIGTLEFNHFKKAPLVAYRQLPFVETGSERQALLNSLLILNELKICFGCIPIVV